MSTTETPQEAATRDPLAVLNEIRQREQAIKDDEWTVVEAHGRDIADEGWSEVRIADQDGNPVAITYMTNVLEPGYDAEYTDFIAHSLIDMSRLLRVVQRLRDLCRDTDGNWLEPSSSLPAGEFQAALALLSEEPPMTPEGTQLAAQLGDAVGGPEVPDPETPLSDAEHAIGEVIRVAGSWQMLGGRLDASHVAGVLLGICAPWTGGLREMEDGRD